MHASPYAENYYSEQRDPGTDFRKQFAVARVKRQLVFRRHLDFAGEYAFGKRAARFIAQYLSNAAKLIHKTGHPRVRRSDHRATRFHTAKNRVCQMLMRPGGMQEPPVICEVHQQVCASNYELPRQIANRVFEANQRRDLRIAAR